jgi:hypothetical protein
VRPKTRDSWRGSEEAVGVGGDKWWGGEEMEEQEQEGDATTHDPNPPNAAISRPPTSTRSNEREGPHTRTTP